MTMQKTPLKTLSRAFVATLLATATLVAPLTAQGAGIPTFDASNLAQAIAQVENQARQIKTMRDQLRATTGNARLGVLLNDPNVQKALAKYNPKGISLADLASGNYDKELKRIADRIAKDQANAQNADPKAQLAQATLINYAQTEVVLNDLEKLSNRAETIARQINQTTDASSKADLTNTLLANNAQIQIELAKFDIAMKQLEQREKQAEKLVINDYVQRKKANNK
ncbi:type IV secretion system protein [Moraxella oculi]|uniref:Type IV secretion system protein n=1 Tax=Moraxella oculi TaxID=2940516 RepID=A0ABW8UD14_9GAMM